MANEGKDQAPPEQKAPGRNPQDDKSAGGKDDGPDRKGDQPNSEPNRENKKDDRSELRHKDLGQ